LVLNVQVPINNAQVVGDLEVVLSQDIDAAEDVLDPAAFTVGVEA